MEEKKCTACGQTKPIKHFYKKKRSKARKNGSIHHWVGRYSKCKKCHDKITARRDPEYQKRYHQKNKGRRLEQSKTWYAKIKQDWWDIIATIMALECTLCGYASHSATLEFHHIDPIEKEVSVHQIMSGVVPNETNVKKLREELEKCKILCANCHREHHAKYNHLK